MFTTRAKAQEQSKRLVISNNNNNNHLQNMSVLELTAERSILATRLTDKKEKEQKESK